MKRVHDIVDFLSFLPILILSVVTESGPSWKTVASAAVGGAFTILVGVGGYWVAQQGKVDDRQDRAISDLRDSVIDSKITTASMGKSLGSIEEQLKALNAKWDARDADERAELRAAQGKK